MCVEKNVTKLKFLPAETSETFHDEHFAEVNGSYKLADIISGWRTGSSLSTKLH